MLGLYLISSVCNRNYSNKALETRSRLRACSNKYNCLVSYNLKHCTLPGYITLMNNRFQYDTRANRRRHIIS